MDYIQTLHARSIDMDLARVADVMSRLGTARAAPLVVSIAGTNGKGSSVALFEAIGRQAGLRTGAYTSPHLVDFNERMRIAGKPVASAPLLASFENVEIARRDTALTYFEFATLVAVDLFVHQAIEFAILEVGLGGRLDAVRACDSDLALITNIGIDHVGWLGPDREHIGREKAGIMRPRGLAVCADRDPPASLLETAAACGADLKLIERDFDLHVDNDGSTRFVFHSNDSPIRTLWPVPDSGIPGEHQRDNTAGVCAAVMALGDALPATDQQITAGIASARLPGRLQVVDGRPRLLLDVAHNVDAANALRRFVDDRIVSDNPAAAKSKVIAVLGMLKDKAVADVVAIMRDAVDRWVLTSLDVERGLTSSELRDAIVPPLAVQRVDLAADPVSALAAARRHADDNDWIVVFGSFHTVGDILAADHLL